METADNKTEARTVTGGPVARFIFNNHSVFELVCKVIIMTIIIPYGSLFLNGLIFDTILGIYSRYTWMAVAILAVMILLFIAGVTLSVISIRRYSKKIKTVSR